jgi:hypothetical protein
MEGYEMDETFSQALDLAEDVENDTIFITHKSTFQNNEGILHVLKGVTTGVSGNTCRHTL